MQTGKYEILIRFFFVHLNEIESGLFTEYEFRNL